MMTQRHSTIKNMGCVSMGSLSGKDIHFIMSLKKKKNQTGKIHITGLFEVPVFGRDYQGAARVACTTKIESQEWSRKVRQAGKTSSPKGTLPWHQERGVSTVKVIVQTKVRNIRQVHSDNV